VRNIFVLSRITLGADVAVTSVILDALRRRFPEAHIRFVGPRKNWELFEAEPRITHTPFPYPRSGSLVERLRHCPRFHAADSIVVDPDSRITQLGILPVCEEDDYYFFESRSFGGGGNEPLPILASRWTAEVFGMTGRAWVAPRPAEETCDAAVSFGVGGNEDKRLGGGFEEQVLRYLTALGIKVMLDAGAGGPETARANDLAYRVPGVLTHEGSFASFAGIISNAALYVGYDSAGGHVAGAAGVPLVSVFGGYPSERMLHRWMPYGSGARRVVRVDPVHRGIALEQTMEAIRSLLE
jgi:ADP-heptose:LPS heptosyltransferase